MPPRSATAAADTAHPLIDRFKSFVNAAAFPCVGAKSALGRGRMRVPVRPVKYEKFREGVRKPPPRLVEIPANTHRVGS